MKKVLLAAACFFLAGIAAAQTKTTVSATVIDPNGIPYANGTVSASLVPGGTSATVGGAGINGQVGPAVTDDNGHFSMDLFCNTAGGACTVPISPSGTKWQFTVCNPGVPSPLGFGNQCFTPAAITITGTTQNISTQLNAVAPQLTRLAGTSITPGPPTGSCTNGQLAIDSTTGVIYTCQSTVWVPATPSSGVGAPVGACQPRQLYIDTATGNLYDCNGGVWHLSTGTGTVTSFSYSQTGLDPLMTGAVATPTTTPALSLTAKTVQPLTFYAGPSSPFIDNVNTTSGNSATISVSGRGSNGSGEFMMMFSEATFPSQAANMVPAGGGWTTIDAAVSTFKEASIYSKVATGAQTVTVPITSANWQGTLAFLGTSGTPALVQDVSVVAGGSTPGCYTTPFTNPVVAGNALLIYIGVIAGAATHPLTFYSVTDNQNDTYVPMFAANSGPLQQIGMVAFNATGGATTFTFCGSGVDPGGDWVVHGYEISNVTTVAGVAYFRPISPTDLQGATQGLGFTQISTATLAPGCNTGLGSNSACNDTLTWNIPFKDTNYQAVCMGITPNAFIGQSTTNQNPVPTISSKSATQIVVTTQTSRSLAAQYDRIDCIGVHP